MKKILFLILITNLIIINSAFSAPVSEQIIVDQIGYRTNSEKWFMIADPRTGQNSAVTYVPGANVQLRRSSDNAVMQTITLSVFNSGNEYAPAGDVVWQGNFSSFTTPGTYHIYDPTNDRQSYNFDIGDNIYNTILRQSIKSYYYQRCGTAITSAYGGTWTHAGCHTQQQNASLYDGGVISGTQRNVSGGWHDAGDYRKYVTFTFTTLWDLMHAYEWYPDRFGDNTGIPESGNGIPDILDEVKYELDWLLRMQKADGSLYSGVFVTSGSSGGNGDPSTETTTYYYANYSTAATVTGAMAFALGARLFAPFNSSYSATLRTAAENAWAFLETHTNNIQYNHSGFQNANANWDDNHEKQGRVAAAAELFHLTGDVKYRNYVDANYNNPNTAESLGHQPINSGYFETGGSNKIQRGLVSYCLAPGATSSVVTAIKNSLNQGIQNQTYGQRNTDAYKAFIWDGHYTWGSNQAKGEWADLALWGVKLNVNPSLSSAYQTAAEEYIHYFHGRNPLSWCYLTQSNSAGADKQITQIYHGWFWDGTVWDTNPAPGFLAGGPNANYVTDTQNSGGTPVYPPGGEPRQKAYRDWNTNWPDCSWSVTEPGIYYQAKYCFLAAAFAGSVATPTNTPTNTPYAGTPTFTRTRTPTPSNTPYFSPTNTPTTTPAPAYTLIYDGDTSGYRLSDGTVHNGSPGTMTEGAYGVTGNGMRLTYTSISGWWQEHWWDKTTNVSIGANTDLVFNVRQASTSPNSVNQLFVRINWTNTIQVDPTYIVEGGSITTTWKTVRVPLSVLIEAGQTVIDFIGFAASWDRDWAVDIDNIRLEGAVPSATPTRTNTINPAFSPTFTATTATIPGFYVSGRHLYSPCGEMVVLRGVNEMFVWGDQTGTCLPEIAKTGANTVRIVWTAAYDQPAQFDALIQTCINNKMIPLVELHDATGDWSLLQTCVNWWIKPAVVSVIQKHEKYLLINIANECGNVVSDTDYRNGYISAISQMRAAGIKVPLIVDASGWGQNENSIINNWSQIFNSDPLHNTMFSIHMWWTDNNPTRINNFINTCVSQNIPVIVGEFAHAGVGCAGTIAYTTIMSACQANQIGYLAWSWGKIKNGDCYQMDMTTTGNYVDLGTTTWNAWARVVGITDPNSIQNTSVRPGYILNGLTCNTVTQTPTRTRTATSTVILSPTFTFTRTATITSTRTQTAVNTATFTATQTFTYTRTSTPTMTNTQVITNTFTATPTWTRTGTATGTYTGTATRTNTPATSTYTGTATRTVTPTYSRTSTPTNTLIITNTFTGTPTRTNTAVITNTFTTTPTWTRTGTPTGTRTPTSISTRTQTPSITPTFTRTITQTHSISPTITQTSTGTPPSPTNTPTASPSFTNTPSSSSTLTMTLTQTSTYTSTRTVTPSFTQTATSSQQATMTMTPTSSQQPTMSFTATTTSSQVASATRTATVTNTQVESATFTRTLTQTPTYTRTNTPTSTLTRTSTSTPTFTQTPTSSQQPAIGNVVIFPNPYNPTKEDLKINILITGQCKLIKVKIYTTGFRLIKQITNEGEYAGEETLTIDKKYLNNLANGVYYLIIVGINNDKNVTEKPQQIIILR
jgi:hypothetical protein